MLHGYGRCPESDSDLFPCGFGGCLCPLWTQPGMEVGNPSCFQWESLLAPRNMHRIRGVSHSPPPQSRVLNLAPLRRWGMTHSVLSLMGAEANRCPQSAGLVPKPHVNSGAQALGHQLDDKGPRSYLHCREQWSDPFLFWP